ncbi:hypothetical protein MesoLj131a_50430 [Mesorhizobium sp. 131-2-1]|nr:hypothetical protein MesoLj131a_50430 [Mesorhizobium sp. 131-2-1]
MQVDEKILMIHPGRYDTDLAGCAIEDRGEYAPRRRERFRPAQIDHHIHLAGWRRRQAAQRRLDGVDGALPAKAVDQSFEFERQTAN